MGLDATSQVTLLADMVGRLVRGLHPERVYLFGSHARGDGGEDSDYDFLVVVERADEPGYERAQAAFRLLCGVPVSKDVIVLTIEEFERKRDVPGSLPETVLREGVLVYAA